MTQNIYDNRSFFEGYSQLARSVEGLDGAPEWPALRALLPELPGTKVLDLGCGFGWFCRWAREQGAATVLGIDVSDNMLARARAMTSDAAIRYLNGDLEDLELAEASFDLAYSSLALHYIENLDRLFAQLHKLLKPGGALVFSVEHPVYTAPSRPGWVESDDGRRTWPVDSYLMEGERRTDWLAKDVIKQHRTIATDFTLLKQQGFTVEHLEEWGPTEAQVAARPEWANERQRPPFLIIGAKRQSRTV